jgi:FkbM family methyltransferase
MDLLAYIRRSGRLGFDRLFWRKLAGLELAGGEASWWICPEMLKPGSKVLSGGAGKDVSFELELVRRGCEVALFDPSPTGRATMELPGNQPAGLQFFPLGLAGRDKIVGFAPPANPAEGSFRTASGESDSALVEFPCVSPSKALELAGFSDCALCKLDIEGFEYEVLEALLDAGIRPAQIAVEYHHFMPGIPWRRTFDSWRRLEQAGYRIVRKCQADYLFVRREFLS